MPPEAKTHMRYSVFWSIFSIGLGAWNLGLLPSRAGAHDLSRDPFIAFFGTWQLFFMAAAGSRLVCVVKAALR
jgi:hypothetical protein